MDPLSDVVDVDDEVIASVDVVLAQPGLCKELYVLDYPTRNSESRIGADRAVECVRFRRGNQRVEMDLSLFPRSAVGVADVSFDFSRFEETGVSVPTVQVLESTRPPKPRVNFGVGAYQAPDDDVDTGSIVIVPVHTVARMRPSFKHFDEADARVQDEKAFAKAAREKEKGGLDMPAERPAGKKLSDREVEVEMTFARRESERVAERKKNSLATVLKIEEVEPWVDMDYVQESHPQVAASRASVFRAESLREVGAKMEDVVDLNLDGTPTAQSAAVKAEPGTMAVGSTSTPTKSYMELLYEHAPSIDVLRRRNRVDTLGAAGGTMPAVPMRSLRAERPDSAVQVMIGSARILPFYMLKECVHPRYPVEELLVNVRKAAVLLRGCWVSKVPRRRSRRLVGSRMPPRVPAARTLVHDMFRRGRIVRTADVYKEVFDGAVHLDEESVLDFLKEVADRRQGVGWVFRYPDGTEFESAFASVVVEENEAWDQRVKDAKRVISPGGAATGRASTQRRHGRN